MKIAVVVTMTDEDNIETYNGYINYCKIYTVDNGKIVSKELVSLNFQCGKTSILVNKYKINYLICGSFPSEKLETRQPKDWHQYGVQAFYGAYGSADEAVELFLQTYYFTLPGVIKDISKNPF